MIPGMGGGLSASTSVSSKSGDATGAADSTFNYNGAFQVGSGSQVATADQTSGGSSSNNTLLYVGLAAVAMMGVLAIVYARRS